MHLLILTACLAASPGDCAPRLLPQGAGGDAAACQARGDSVSADWLAGHPGLTGKGWTCVPLDQAPALELTELAPGVHVHRGADGPLSRENRGRIANLGVVVGDQRVAVIDPGGSREEGEALFAAIRRLTDLPIGPVILTHMHPDHIAGAEVMAEAGGEIIADARLPDALAARRETWLETIPAQIGAQPWLGTALVAPARVIAAETTLDLGGTALTLTPVATAHTDSDLTVTDSESGGLFAGDLVFIGLTPVLDGSLRGWLDWIARKPDPEPAFVVPGHGPVTAPREAALAPEAQYLTSLREATRAALQAALPLSRAVPAITAAMAPVSEGWVDFPASTARNAAVAFAQLEWE